MLACLAAATSAVWSRSIRRIICGLPSSAAAMLLCAGRRYPESAAVISAPSHRHAPCSAELQRAGTGWRGAHHNAGCGVVQLKLGAIGCDEAVAVAAPAGGDAAVHRTRRASSEGQAAVVC